MSKNGDFKPYQVSYKLQNVQQVLANFHTIPPYYIKMEETLLTISIY